MNCVQNDRTVSGVLCWLKLFRCLFPGKVMLSWSGLDVVSSQDLNSCLPMSTFTSDASNATTTRYHYTRERSGEIMLYTNPYSFQGIYTIYVRNYRKWKWRIVFEYCSPCPLFHKEKRSVVKSFKLTRKFQQISGFLLNTSQKFFFQNIFFGGGQLPPLPAPPLATALLV